MVFDQKTIKYKGNRVFEKLVLSTDFKRIPKFFVENEACFLFVTEGSFKFRTPRALIEYKMNDAMLAKCGNYFIESQPHESNAKRLTVIGAFFYPDMVKSFFANDLSLAPFTKKYDVIKVNVEPLLKNYIESIDFLLENQDLVDDNMIFTKLKELLLILAKSEKAESISSFIVSLFEPTVYKFNEVIENNLYANISLPELAKLCNCSLATFKRKFSETYHASPNKYITQKKLEKATQLLQIKSMLITDIAYACGFETITYFNRIFKATYAKTPSEYRLSQ